MVIDDGSLLQFILGVGDAVGVVLHRLDEVAALADDADGAYDVVAWAATAMPSPALVLPWTDGELKDFSSL